MKVKYWPVLTILLILIDQLLKWWLTFRPNSFEKFFEITKNTNYIFGYGQPYDLLFLISILLILMLAIFTVEKVKNQKIALAIMLAGAISNFLDIIFRSGVIDYFKINIANSVYFNLADLYLFVGLFYYLYLLGKENEKNKNNFFRHK